MRIKEEFKKSGYFWLPTTPERKIPGTLSITDGGDIDLEVFGLFDDSPTGINNVLNNQVDLGRIIGQIEEHALVTLDGCCYKNPKFSFFGGIHKPSVRVSKVLLGVAYDEKELISFNTFQFSVEGIDEWVGLSGINVERQLEKRTATITYSPPNEVSLNINNGMKLLIIFSSAVFGSQNTVEATITQKTYFKLVSEEARPVNDFISTAYIITTFLCFAIDKTVCIDWAVATENSLLEDIGHGKSKPALILIYYPSVMSSLKCRI